MREGERMTRHQRLLAAHGSVEEFADACFAGVPGYLSVDEAHAAIQRYRDDLRFAQIHDRMVQVLDREGVSHPWKNLNI